MMKVQSKMTSICSTTVEFLIDELSMKSFDIVFLFSQRNFTSSNNLTVNKISSFSLQQTQLAASKTARLRKWYSYEFPTLTMLNFVFNVFF